MIGFLLSLSVAFSAPATEGQEIGNAAGGVKNGGQTMTFESAKVPVVAKPLRFNEIPGLLKLTDRIVNMPLTAPLRKEIMSWVYPSSTLRTYYKINETELSPEGRKKLIHEYSRLMKVPEEQVVLFALTNHKGETFLLPEFYNLNEIQQQAILLHEGLWKYDMSLSYKDVIEAEMAAQRYFENSYDPEIYFHFFETLSNILGKKTPHPEVLLMAGLSFDQIQPPEEDAPYMLLWKLLGQDFLKCYRQQKMQGGNDGSTCTDELVMSLQGSSFYQRKYMFSESLIYLFKQYPQNYYLCLFKKDRTSSDFSSEDEFQEWLTQAIVPGIGRLKTLHDPPVSDIEVSLTPEERKSTAIISTITDGYGKFWGNLALCRKHP